MTKAVWQWIFFQTSDGSNEKDGTKEDLRNPRINEKAKSRLRMRVPLG